MKLTSTDFAFKSIDIGSIQVSVDGDLFACDNIHTTRYTNSLIQITASEPNVGLTIVLSSRSTGLYNIGGEEANSITYTNVTYIDSGSVETKFTSQQKSNSIGTIEVLETDLENNTISGVFNGTIVLDNDANTSLEITNGLFNQIPF